jgi:hypothetical protein
MEINSEIPVHNLDSLKYPKGYISVIFQASVSHRQGLYKCDGRGIKMVSTKFHLGITNEHTPV